MGRPRRSRTKRGRSRSQKDGGKPKGGQDGQRESRPFARMVLDNDEFREYYQRQEIVPKEEWDTFLEYMRLPLPVAFRLIGTPDNAMRKTLSNVLEQRIAPQLAKALKQPLEKAVVGSGEGGYDEAEEFAPPHIVEWYPGRSAWIFSASRRALRKDPRLESLKKFLGREVRAGLVRRQELVSMIPPLFLDVQPQHCVYDVCAAPGSKSSQILEFLTAHGGHPGVYELGRNTHPKLGFAEGMLVANDENKSRCGVLVHEMKYLDTEKLVVLNHPGQSIPSIRLQPVPGEKKQTYLFDRILCDVPCSGDGTFRKQPDMWRTWSSRKGKGIHRLQSIIALRSVQLLKPGGKMVYSTCSLNPLEDEAVVAQLLRENRSLELVDVSDQLPMLKRRAGLSHWEVKHSDEKYYRTFADLPEADQPQVHASLFQPTEEEAKKMRLDRWYVASWKQEENDGCSMRFLPQDADSGGFFVAVLRKAVEMEEEEMEKEEEEEGEGGMEEAKDPKDEEEEEEVRPKFSELGVQMLGDGFVRGGKPLFAANAKHQPKRLRNQVEEPFIIGSPPPEIIRALTEFYGLKPGFPWHRIARRFIRDDGSAQQLFMLGERTYKWLKLDVDCKLRLILAGSRIMTADTSQSTCPYRLTQEGLIYMLPWMSKRVVKGSWDDLRVIISPPPVEEVKIGERRSQRFQPFEKFSKEASAQLVDLPLGPCVLEIDPANDEQAAQVFAYEKIHLAAFRGQRIVTLMVKMEEVNALYDRYIESL